jgi:hypothetical protein
MTRRKTRHKRDTTVVGSRANVYVPKVAIATSVDVDKCVKRLKSLLTLCHPEGGSHADADLAFIDWTPGSSWV